MSCNLHFRKILTAVWRMERGRLLLEGVQLGGNCSSGRKEVSESKVLPSVDRGFLRDLAAEAVISTDNGVLRLQKHCLYAWQAKEDQCGETASGT